MKYGLSEMQNDTDAVYGALATLAYLLTRPQTAATLRAAVDDVMAAAEPLWHLHDLQQLPQPQLARK
jgi:hypothetical protein